MQRSTIRKYLNSVSINTILCTYLLVFFGRRNNSIWFGCRVLMVAASGDRNKPSKCNLGQSMGYKSLLRTPIHEQEKHSGCGLFVDIAFIRLNSTQLRHFVVSFHSISMFFIQLCVLYGLLLGLVVAWWRYPQMSLQSCTCQ